MERGDLFGEMGLFDGLGRSAEARALEQSSVIMHPLRRAPRRLGGQARAAVVGGSPAEPAHPLHRRGPGRLASSSTSPAGPPSTCSSSPAQSEEFEIPITQEELAGLVGASRERVNKAIASFLRLGWIEQNDRTLPDPQAPRARDPLQLARIGPSRASRRGTRAPGPTRRRRRRPGGSAVTGRARSRGRHPRSRTTVAPAASQLVDRVGRRVGIDRPADPHDLGAAPVTRRRRAVGPGRRRPSRPARGSSRRSRRCGRSGRSPPPCRRTCRPCRSR